MEKTNYQLILDKKLQDISTLEKRPSLLLHSCCAPCSSYVLEYLSNYFDITCYFFNPNISTSDEYEKRANELLRLASEMPLPSAVKVIIAEYEPKSFEEIAKGREELEEGGTRCFDCYKLRLAHTAKYAKEKCFDYFTTSLSISPYKNAAKLNEIGAYISSQYGVQYLYSDFKKKNGYLRSCKLSEQYGLYRQDYCGCIYSKLASEKKKALNQAQH